MKNYEDYIAEALKSGVEPEDLIDDFAKQVADAQVKRSQDLNRIQDTKDIISVIRDYIKKYYPDSKIDENLETIKDSDAEDVIEIFDGYMEMIKLLTTGNGRFKINWKTNSPLDFKDSKKEKKTSNNEIINNLFKNFWN